MNNFSYNEKKREYDVEKNFKKLPNGQRRFAKGNQIAKYRKGFTLKDLNKLVFDYCQTKNVNILEHYSARLLKNDKLLENYIEKNCPTKIINEIEHHIPDVVEVVHYIQGNPPKIIEEKNGSDQAKNSNTL